MVVYLDCLWLFALVAIGGGGGCRLNCGWLLGLWCLILAEGLVVTFVVAVDSWVVVDCNCGTCGCFVL